MRISVPREIKNNESRVAITPPMVHDLTALGHEIFIEKEAGLGSGIPDKAYQDAGATILDSAEKIWEIADILLKVKEPITSEYKYFREGLILFTYLHLAAEKALTKALIDDKVTAISYETVQLEDGSLPLLAPMSEVAGRLSTIVAANTLFKTNGGPGMLIGGVPGTHQAHVVILGAGVAGSNALAPAVGLGARVSALDTNLERLREIDAVYGSRVETLASNTYEIKRILPTADIVIGSILIAGAQAPKIVTNEMVATMKPNSVLVDISVDQGGCFEDTRPTTHQNPTFRMHNSTFYCVANMPGIVPRTSTYALTNATMPYVKALAQDSLEALTKHPGLAKGLNTHKGFVTYEAVAKAWNLPYRANMFL